MEMYFLCKETDQGPSLTRAHGGLKVVPSCVLKVRAGGG